MEDKLQFYFDQVKHLTDDCERAKELLRILNSDTRLNESTGHRPVLSLDDALNNFYIKKECTFIRHMLEHFINFGNFDLSDELIETVYKFDRFQNIRMALIEFLGDSVMVNNSKR